MTYDEWYQEHLRKGFIKQPSKAAYDTFRRYWLLVEASGEQPTTASIVKLIMTEFSDNIRRGCEILSEAFTSTSEAMTAFAEAAHKTQKEWVDDPTRWN